MAFKIPHSHLYGNFRPTVRERSKPRLSAQQRREGNCERHLAALRKLPCCVTGRTPAGQVHHLKRGPAAKERAFQRRATDRWGLPLSFDAHILGVERVPTNQELSWFRGNGIEDPYELAAALWNASPDVDRMVRIVQSHIGRPQR